MQRGMGTLRAMHTMALAAAICVGQASVSAAADEVGVEFTDPTRIARQFADELAKLQAEGQATDLARLRDQLPDERACSVRALPSSGQAKDPRELYATCRKSVVLVGRNYKCNKCGRRHTSTATGFLISRDGAVVTDYHVLAAAAPGDAFAVRTWDGRVLPIRSVLAASKADDLAVVQVEAGGLLPLPVACSAPVGTEVFVISHPVDHFYMMTAGIVSGHFLRRQTSKTVARHEMTITADFAKGSSGAPVLDRNGAVVGIVRSTAPVYYEKLKGVGAKMQMVLKYCIPSRSLRKLLAGP